MGNLQLLFAVSLTALTVACGRDESAVPDDARPAEPAAAAAAGGSEEPVDEILVPLPPAAGSSVSGEAILLRRGDDTEVTLSLFGATGAGTHQAHIHRGTCETLGPVAAPLEPVTSDEAGRGSSSSTVDVPFAEVFNGDYVIAAHQAGAEPGAPVLCGQLPRQTV